MPPICMSSCWAHENDAIAELNIMRGLESLLFKEELKYSQIIHRPEKVMDIQSECIVVSAITAMVHLCHENETLLYQQAWEGGTKNL